MSIKIRSSWIDNNTYSLGVRVYRKLEVFTIDSLPNVYATIPKGTTSYEDTNVEEGQTYFYMLGVFNNGQEVFTECYEVKASKELTTLNFVKVLTSPARYSVPSSAWPLTVPPHNSGDIVIVLKSGADTELASYGFTKLDVSGLTDNFINPWFKIAQSSQLNNTDILLSNSSDKSCVILRPSVPVTEVLFEISSNSTQFIGSGDSISMASFQTPFFNTQSGKKGYFMQVYSPGATYAGSGKAQTVTVSSPASLLASSKIPINYDYASAYAEPINSNIKAFNKAIFGQVSDGTVSKFGGYNAAINYFSNTSTANRFLNLLIMAR